MRHLTARDYRSMPWRNGGGTTTEITISPEGAALSGARFLYRVSIADVATDGPFSRFEGYDRHIMLLAGAGMTLDCKELGRFDLVLREPREFSGDWDVHGTLVAGAVRDFNLIVDRARATSSLEVWSVTEPRSVVCESGSECVVYVLEGALTAAATGETLVADRTFELSPKDASVATLVAVARVSPRSE